MIGLISHFLSDMTQTIIVTELVKRQRRRDSLVYLR